MSKLNWMTLGVGLAGVVLATGCATQPKTEFKTGTDFSKYRTFALLPLPQRASSEDPGLVLRLAQPARDAVTSALTAKGLKAVPVEEAELTVNLKGQSMPRVEVNNYGYSYPVMTRYGTVNVVRNPYTSVSTTTERTLIIEMFDTKLKELVWVGWLKKDSSGKVTAQALQEAINKILDKFPPTPKPTS